MVSYRRMMLGAAAKGGSFSMILLSFILLFTLFPGHCCAQTSQNQTISITTYFPARYGVYRNPRLIPLDNEPTSPQYQQEGTIYFNKTEQKLYIYNGTQWIKVGSGISVSSVSPVSPNVFASSGWKVYSGHLVSPDECHDTPIAGYETQLCEWDGYYKTITFPGNFSQKPHVIVVVERNPDIQNSPCTDGITDSLMAFADQITNTSFRITAGGSPSWWSTCGPGGLEAKRARAKVGWIAIGK